MRIIPATSFRVGTIVCMVLLLNTPTFSQEEVAQSRSREPIVQHLEFLGYHCESLNQRVNVTHPSKIGFLLVPLKDGIMVQSAFSGIEAQASSTTINSVNSGLSRLSVINELNKHASVSRFFWADTGELVIRASILGSYDKRRFYTFMAAWEKDGQTLGQNYQGLRPYLK